MTVEQYVLIVDDLGMIRESARHFLRHTPVAVMTAVDGEEALRMVRERKPALIFADILTPRMTGVQLCSTLKGDGDLKKIPVILMLNTDDPQQVDAASRAGADALIPKPLDRREFLDTGRTFFPRIDRREPRIPASIPFTYEGDGYLGSATSLDISVGGTYLLSVEPVPRETILSLTFVLPLHDGVTLSTTGRVAWVNDRRGGELANPHLPAGFGVEFVGSPEPVKYYLRKFVEGGGR